MKANMLAAVRNAHHNFWVQPSKGLDENSRGCSPKELDAWEQAAEKALPPLLREHLQKQNGGIPRYPVYCDPQGNAYGLFVNGEVFCGLNGMANSLRPVLENIMDDEEIDALAKEHGLHLEHLRMLSYQDGHSCICLDYGYKQEHPLQTPRIVAFDLEDAILKEIFHVESYESFVARLHYAGTDTEFYVGVESDLSLDKLAQHFSEKLNCGFGKDTSDCYGWFNFDAWYNYGENTSDGYRLFILSPNQHRSGTFLFPEDANTPYIFCVRYNSFNKLDTISKRLTVWMEQLHSKRVSCRLLLAPSLTESDW